MAQKLNHTNNGQTSGNSDNALGSYHLLAVGTSDRTIRVTVPLPMSQSPYRKEMVADLFFGTIKGLVMDSTLFSADFVVNIAGYFDFNTSLAEEKAMVAAQKIRATIFKVELLTGLGFRNHKG